MASAEDILKELEGMGALGKPKEQIRRTVTEVELEEGAPPARLIDARGSRTVNNLVSLVKNMKDIREAADSAVEALEALIDVWTTKDESTYSRPTESVSRAPEDTYNDNHVVDDVDPMSEEDEEAAMERAVNRMAAQQSKNIEASMSPDLVKARQTAIARIRGEYSEMPALPKGQVSKTSGPVKLSPDIKLPDLAPSVPEET